MLGAIADYLPFAPDVLLDCIVKRFARKGEQVVEANRQAFAAGRDAVAKQLGAATPA
jgi:indolepyruvate ferredoxin oxidoreductase beta subunit